MVIGIILFAVALCIIFGVGATSASSEADTIAKRIFRDEEQRRRGEDELAARRRRRPQR